MMGTPAFTIALVRRERGVAFSMDVYADNLVANLRALHPDWQIIEIAPDSWGQGTGDLWRSGTGVRKYYERFWRHPRAVCQLQADLFHIIDHSNAHVAYWLHQLQRPTVVTCHDLVQWVYPQILRDQSRFPAFSMAAWRYSVNGMTQAQQVIAVSNNTARDVARYLAIEPQRIVTIPNGVDQGFAPLPLESTLAFRQRYNCPLETLCLLNVGSTHQRKNIPTVLHTLRDLRDRGIATQLWRIGEAFTQEQQALIDQFQLAPLITQIPLADATTLVQAYNAADVLVAPSLYEGFGLTVLEAMACGTPVIAARTSSLPEVVGAAAMLVDPLDVGAIAAAVCRVQQEPAYRAQMVQAGRDRAKTFTWAKSAAATAQLYQTLIHPHPQPGFVEAS
jgi:glycosyltransferase involved in cell wall biosynthesis